MASTDARPVPLKNTAYRLYLAIRDTAGALVTTWAGQDSEVSLDGDTFADCTNEATEIGTSGVGYLDLTAAEMNADAVVVKVSVTNMNAVNPVFVLFPEELGDIRINPATILDFASAIDGKTPRESLRYIAAVLAGKISDAGTDTETFIGLDGTTPRVEFTVDASGNRSAVTYDPTP